MEMVVSFGNFVNLFDHLSRFFGIHKDIWVQVKIGKILKDADVEIKKIIDCSKGSEYCALNNRIRFG